MKNCRKIGKKLSAYQDNEVAAAEKDAIEAHLQTCAACSKQYQILLQTYGLLRSMPGIDPSPGLFRRIVQGATLDRRAFRVRALGLDLRFAAAFTGIALIALSGLWAGTTLGNFLARRHFQPARSFSAIDSGRTLTLSSLKAFDAAPPGSFAAGYLKLAQPILENKHAK